MSSLVNIRPQNTNILHVFTPNFEATKTGSSVDFFRLTAVKVHGSSSPGFTFGFCGKMFATAATAKWDASPLQIATTLTPSGPTFQYIYLHVRV